MNRQIEMPINNNISATSRSLKKQHPNNQNLYQDDREFLELLREVKIRFDTNPKFYQKEDYQKLIEIAARLGGIPADEFALKSDIPDKVSQLDNDSGYLTEHQDISEKQNVMRIEHVSGTSQSLSIYPNIFYKFDDPLTSLNLTLSELDDSTIAQEYIVEFVSSSTPTTLTVPNTVNWIKNPEIKASKRYYITIVDNLGIIGEWS